MHMLTIRPTFHITHTASPTHRFGNVLHDPFIHAHHVAVHLHVLAGALLVLQHVVELAQQAHDFGLVILRHIVQGGLQGGVWCVVCGVV